MILKRVTARKVLGRLVASALGAGLWVGGSVAAADLKAQRADLPAPVPAPSEWSFRFTPYGWLTALDGTQTVRGRTVKVDASFIDVLEKSDTLVGLMANMEARNGPFALYADVVWSKVGLGADTVRTRSVVPAIATTVGRSLDLELETGIVEAGAAYEIVRSGSLAFDLLGGARYWLQKADLSLAVTRTIDIGDLEVVRERAIARSGSVDWVDPLVGARLRYALAPGHELFVRGDVGGFGVGSNFSWQAIAGYGFDFGLYNGITFSGILGYRALSVDYVQGEGRRRYEFDMLQHGPVLGISMRF
jgi:hypothetical protein